MNYMKLRKMRSAMNEITAGMVFNSSQPNGRRRNVLYINLKRIEFVITNACSGRCKHCSWGNLPDRSSSIDADAAVSAIRLLTGRFEVESIMTFGGEPLLFDETVCKIHSAARDCGIQNRQLITNGFFSKDERIIDEIAKNICDAGVNYVMLSVDAFHQETIPIDTVLKFAEALTAHGISKLRVHPAWVVNKENENTYNAETKRLLKLFADKGIPASNGNNIFLSGNALKHLAEYYPLPGRVDFSLPCGSAPYSSRPDNVDCICINPDGAVNACTELGNIYSNCILDIVDNYDPYKDPALKEVLDGGVPGLLKYIESLGIEIDVSDCRSACNACRKAIAVVKGTEGEV